MSVRSSATSNATGSPKVVTTEFTRLVEPAPSIVAVPKKDVKASAKKKPSKTDI